MADPVFPNDACVETLRSSVATLLAAQPSPQQCCDQIVAALHGIEEASKRGDFLKCAAHAGNISSFGLLLLLDALARMPPKGPMQ